MRQNYKRDVAVFPVHPRFASVMNALIAITAAEALLRRSYAEMAGIEGTANIEVADVPRYGWRIQIRDRRLRYLRGLSEHPLCVIRASERTLSDLLTQDSGWTTALLTGEIIVEGDALFTPAFIAIFSRFRRLAHSSSALERGLAWLISRGGWAKESGQ